MATPMKPRAKVAPPFVPKAPAVNPPGLPTVTPESIAAAHKAAPEGNPNCAMSAADWHDSMMSLGAGGISTAADVPLGMPRDPSVAVATRHAPEPYRIAAARPRRQRGL